MPGGEEGGHPNTCIVDACASIYVHAEAPTGGSASFISPLQGVAFALLQIGTGRTGRDARCGHSALGTARSTVAVVARPSPQSALTQGYRHASRGRGVQGCAGRGAGGCGLGLPDEASVDSGARIGVALSAGVADGRLGRGDAQLFAAEAA